SAREADAVVVSAGFRFGLDKMGFLTPDAARRVAVRDGWPVLDRHFRSTDPALQFVGFAAERRFGPIARFVSGSPVTAHRLASRVLTRPGENRASAGSNARRCTYMRPSSANQ